MSSLRGRRSTRRQGTGATVRGAATGDEEAGGAGRRRRLGGAGRRRRQGDDGDGEAQRGSLAASSGRDRRTERKISQVLYI